VYRVTSGQKTKNAVCLPNKILGEGRAATLHMSVVAAKTVKLLELWPYQETVFDALQPRDAAGRFNFCSWFLRLLRDGEVGFRLIFFSDEALFHFHGHVSSKKI
jgi:hypothetical protein